MTLPMTLSDERTECDRHQQDHKRHHDRPVRKCRGETQNRNHEPLDLSLHDPSMKLGFVAVVLRNVRKAGRVDDLQDAGTTRKLAATSISAVCGNMSSGVTDSVMNFSCRSEERRVGKECRSWWSA